MGALLHLAAVAGPRNGLPPRQNAPMGAGKRPAEGARNRIWRKHQILLPATTPARTHRWGAGGVTIPPEAAGANVAHQGAKVRATVRSEQGQ
jgi:hypothetical protein